MAIEIGILFAFGAMLFWGFGDFFIQKSTRKFGDWETLFFLELFGAIVLLPFVYKDIGIIFSSLSKELIILILASIVVLFAALLDFEALKRGKLAIVEPIFSLEIPAAALFAYFILDEVVSVYQIIIIVFLVLGLILVSLKDNHFKNKKWLEKGILFVVFGALFMGAANFMIGAGARETSPLIINWFVSAFVAIICFIYLIYSKRIIAKDILKNKGMIFGMCTLDKAAWVSFAFAMTLTSIAVATALSESYIIIAVLLGLYANKERLRVHQKVGLVLAIVSAITLAITIT